MKKRFYLCGGISNLEFEEAANWRSVLTNTIKEVAEVPVSIFNPIYAAMVDDPAHDDIVAMKYELDILRKSDVVIAYLNDPKSLGSMAEIAIAYEHRIPILGILPNSVDMEDIHPWIIEMCDYIFDDLMDFFEYLQINYLEDF